ncbi:type II secretion system protein [Paucilactobacillus wasatchensis]|uniref:type II secretion system protein n=1 Tax=Paucilactobacillus wasatchensis TaxID=1335616 RepID=UPI001CDB1A61|nr:type II secretion system protein [Paucilactobacillus wasatchensis]
MTKQLLAMIKQKGFTLLETLIVLGLISLTFSFGTLQLRQIRDASNERHFWQALQQEWQVSQTRAQGDNNGTDIVYLAGPQIIRFKWRAADYTTHYNDVAIPVTIKVVSFAPLKMLANGYVKAQTQKFRSMLTNQTYDMKVQLAWGGYYVAVEK